MHPISTIARFLWRHHATALLLIPAAALLACRSTAISKNAQHTPGATSKLQALYDQSYFASVVPAQIPGSHAIQVCLTEGVSPAHSSVKRITSSACTNPFLLATRGKMVPLYFDLYRVTEEINAAQLAPASLHTPAPKSSGPAKEGLHKLQNLVRQTDATHEGTPVALLTHGRWGVLEPAATDHASTAASKWHDTFFPALSLISGADVLLMAPKTYDPDSTTPTYHAFQSLTLPGQNVTLSYAGKDENIITFAKDSSQVLARKISDAPIAAAGQKGAEDAPAQTIGQRWNLLAAQEGDGNFPVTSVRSVLLQISVHINHVLESDAVPGHKLAIAQLCLPTPDPKQPQCENI